MFGPLAVIRPDRGEHVAETLMRRSGNRSAMLTPTFPEEARASGREIRSDFFYYGSVLVLTLLLFRLFEMAALR